MGTVLVAALNSDDPTTERVFRQNLPAFGAVSVDRFTPGDEVAIRIVRAAVEGRAFLRSLLNNLSAILWTGNLYSGCRWPGDVLALWIT